MPLEPYRYPDVLYCDKCQADVDTSIEMRTAEYVNNDTGKCMLVPYRAAVCHVCGNTLCERDKEIAFVIHISKGRSDGQ